MVTAQKLLKIHIEGVCVKYEILLSFSFILYILTGNNNVYKNYFKITPITVGDVLEVKLGLFVRDR